MGQEKPPQSMTDGGGGGGGLRGALLSAIKAQEDAGGEVAP